jgi:DNA-directed RNA polymerase sigma subunit (sigma70/sigma32)
MMNLTGERVRQIERKTLLKLKDMKEQGLLPHVEFDNEDLTQEIIL